MRYRCLTIAALAAALLGPAALSPAQAKKTVYDFSLVGPDGKVSPLSAYKGKVLLIVNLASQSYYEKQLAGLEELQKTYGDRGLVVLGIPSGDFGKGELTDVAATKKFYDGEKLTFPVFAPASVRGIEEIPLYGFLTEAKTGAAEGEVHWNYTKFLVDREGQVAARFEATEAPMDPDMRVTIEKLLDGSLHKKPAGDKNERASARRADDDDSR